MQILENTRYRLRIEFREECTAQFALGMAFAVAALLNLALILMGERADELFLLVLSTVIAIYALTEKISYGCLADRTTGQVTIFRRNGLGQQQSLTYPIRDIDQVEVVESNQVWGRPCCTDICLKSGQRLRLMSYQSCAVQRQVTNRLMFFLQI